MLLAYVSIVCGGYQCIQEISRVYVMDVMSKHNVSVKETGYQKQGRIPTVSNKTVI